MSKTKLNLLFYLRMINHENIKKNYKQRFTCEKNDVCVTVTIDADFYNNNNNNMRAVKSVVYR